MSFGQNLQFLRKMGNKMTQEELAEKLNVSRQTISKWELDNAYPEMEKLIEICNIFSCNMDDIVRGNMYISDEAYSEIRFEDVDAFRFVKYAVISQEPETDAIEHMRNLAKGCKVEEPDIIGWDFPNLSQEQINVYNMRGYEAAWILPEEFFGDFEGKEDGMEILSQEKQKYIAITITDPMKAPFLLIPNAYKVLMTHMKVNGISDCRDKKVIPCFEREYEEKGVYYMDIYIAVE